MVWSAPKFSGMCSVKVCTPLNLATLHCRGRRSSALRQQRRLSINGSGVAGRGFLEPQATCSATLHRRARCSSAIYEVVLGSRKEFWVATLTACAAQQAGWGGCLKGHQQATL